MTGGTTVCSWMRSRKSGFKGADADIEHPLRQRLIIINQFLLARCLVASPSALAHLAFLNTQIPPASRQQPAKFPFPTFPELCTDVTYAIMNSNTLIGFGDADSFYASAEAVRRPWLTGLPVGVLGNQGACVIARNYPMKRYGVKVGEPVWKAKNKCPNGVYVKRDFRWYESLSRRMLTEVGTFSPKVEYYSIDEFFWEGYCRAGQNYQQTAVSIREHIKRSTGLPMTVAFARTRVLAKLFADTAKPFGAVSVEDPDHETELLAKLPVTEIAGIASRRAARLAPHGIKTCLDLRNASGLLVQSLLTITGHDLWRELNGYRTVPIRPNRPRQKMLARGGSLAGRVQSPHTLYGWLVRNLERLIEELQFHAVRPSALTVALDYHDADPASACLPLPMPSARFDVLLDAARTGLKRCWQPGKTATHMHVIASALRRGPWQQSLFDPPNHKLDAVARVKQEINEQLGRWSLRSGPTLWANDWYEDPANEYEVCDIRGKFCF
jgi:DNA polymerase V